MHTWIGGSLWALPQTDPLGIGQQSCLADGEWMGNTPTPWGVGAKGHSAGAGHPLVTTVLQHDLAWRDGSPHQHFCKQGGQRGSPHRCRMCPAWGFAEAQPRGGWFCC